MAYNLNTEEKNLFMLTTCNYQECNSLPALPNSSQEEVPSDGLWPRPRTELLFTTWVIKQNEHLPGRVRLSDTTCIYDMSVYITAADGRITHVWSVGMKV